jgi:hypothetical protein
VHNGGELDKQKLKELQTFLALYPSIHVDQFNRILLDEDACEVFLKAVRGLFFSEIFKAVRI